jgi:hypothetical protein
MILKRKIELCTTMLVFVLVERPKSAIKPNYNQ